MGENLNKKCSVEQKEEIGRYVKANAKISTGECILLEQPSLILASDNEKRCNNCFNLAQSYCNICKITNLCRNCRSHNQYDCEKLASMKNLDCDLLKKFGECYGIVKCLLLQENPETRPYFERMLVAECYLEQRRGTDIWKHYNVNVVKPLMKCGILKYLSHGSQVNDDLIQRLCALIDVNGFEIRAPDGGSMKGVYIQATLLSHDCTPNTEIAIDDKYCMKIYANREIQADEAVTNCYTNVLLGTDERRKILKSTKYFHCNCKRCEDPTEFESYLSSLLCTACEKGTVVKNYQENKWQCQSCQHLEDTQHIEKIVGEFQEEILQAPNDIYQLEMSLQKLSKTLHPNHYLIVDIKQNIASILRMIINNPSHCPGRNVYERKIELCEDILKVLNLILPGTISRMKAITLYELVSTQAEYHRMRYKENELNKTHLKQLLIETEQMLREAVRMLLYEPKDTPEGNLLQTMLQELKYLQTDIKMLD
ncbi:SET domain-containing protein SmydA-8 [Stomoxys calcitrans]|uniref:SET domain-containing protein SmydA-8 n=1 Tax=Stomoxys calcitrans TaxID=35570 RepID=UPI0027E29F1C|nr:SET domain-containing protein SmydA-8 [Stomoxys calcitrans]